MCFNLERAEKEEPIELKLSLRLENGLLRFFLVALCVCVCVCVRVCCSGLICHFDFVAVCAPNVA